MEDMFGNRIIFAEQDKTEHYGIEMKRVLTAIAFFMSDDPEEWLKKVWVSDMSSMGDFAMDDSDLTVVGEVLKVPVGYGDMLWEIAQRIHERVE